MKNLSEILIIIAFTVMSINVYSQDIITKKDGTDISAKVLELTITEIKYKRTDNLSGPVYSLLKSDVLMIRYEDGTKDLFNEKVSSINNSIPDEEMCKKGKEDAVKYYPNKHTGAGWTLATAAVTDPLLGLIPAISCGNRIPKDYNLNYPDTELMKNADYNRCYKEQAQKMKRKKIWKLFGIGSGIYAAALTYNLIMIINN